MGLFSNIQGAASAVTRGKRPSIDQPGGPGSGPTDGPPPPGEDDETSVLYASKGGISLQLLMSSPQRPRAREHHSSNDLAATASGYLAFDPASCMLNDWHVSNHRPGMDLQKVSFPTFVLEPRSMLERITDFMSHPELVFGAENIPDAEERFVQVLSYYLSGWHIKPKGVKKPYNPVLGEIFRCRYEYPDGTKGFYIAEQVSHHPPISAYFYISPHNKVRIAGELRPKSRFLGNSVATMMEGENRVLLMGRPDDGEYVLGLPNMFARGILFGTMILELGDTTMCKNEATGMSCAVEFKTKGWMGGQYNVITGKIKKGGATEIGSIDGRWSHQLDYKDSRNGKQRVLFNANQQKKSMVQKQVAPESEQEPNESRRLWSKLTAAIANKDMEAAQAAKAEVEESQRALAREREAKGIVHKTRFFELRNGLWHAKIDMLEDPDEMIAAVEKWMWAPPPQD